MSPAPSPAKRPQPAAPRPPAHTVLEQRAVGGPADDDEDTDSANKRPPQRSDPRGTRPPAPPIPSPRRPASAQRPAPPVPDEAEPRVKLPSPALRQRPYTRFQWQNLPKVPSAEVNLLKRVEWILPADPGKAAAAVGERLKALFEHDCTIKLTHIFLTQPAELKKLIPEPSFMAQLALAPHVPRGLLEVELALAHACIDQLLGGAAGEAVVLRQLTDIEEGVLAYMMLEGLKALSPSLDPERPRLRLESAVRGVDDALALLDPSEPLVVLQHVFTIGEVASGYFRLILPSAAVDGAQPSDNSPDQRERKARLFERHRERLRRVKDALRAEIAHCELSALDLRGIGPGDVVLVEEPLARPDLGEGGSCKLRVGLGQRGFWSARLEVAGGELQATLEELVLGAELPAAVAAPHAEARASPPEPEIFGGEELPGGRTMETTVPAPDAPWEERGNVSDSNSSELLNDVPLHVSVEIARVPVTADEVVALRSGQVLSLGRPPTSAVELSVNGKVVAQGELVEVDGQLGVKITQLVA